MKTDRKTRSGCWLRLCRCGEEFVIEGPHDKHKTCPDHRSDRSGCGDASELLKTRRIRDGSEFVDGADPADVRDRSDSDLTLDDPFDPGHSRLYSDEE